MTANDGQSGVIGRAARRIELTEGLRHAIDRKFQRLLKAAKADWERLFTGREQSNSGVIVRVDQSETAGKVGTLPGCGFLKPRKPSDPRESGKDSLPRFAH